MIVRAERQDVLLTALRQVLKPIIALFLRSGLGSGEFVSLVKSLFVEVATQEFGIRGRPTNISRVAAMTGISRKEVRRIRADDSTERWTPAMEAAPANVVLHYWHYDILYCEPNGLPRRLPFKGRNSFSSLVGRYGGDIPAGALRTELMRAGTISQDAEGLLVVNRRFHQPTMLSDDFVRNLGFSLKSLAETLDYNAKLIEGSQSREESGEVLGRFERFAWTEYLSHQDVDRFKSWVRAEGERFVERADDWIGNHEIEQSRWSNAQPHTVGVGVYYFEEEKQRRTEGPDK